MEATAAPGAVLTDAERERLELLEERVSQGLDALVSSGRALLEIRERELFREHGSFKTYVEQRLLISQPRAYSLMYSAEIANALEAAGEQPTVTETALRELAPVLRRQGAQGAVAAYRLVLERHTGRRPPSAGRVRSILLDAGLVDRPVRDHADEFCRRLVSLEGCAQRLEPHEKLRPLLTDYAIRLRALAGLVDGIAQAGDPTPRMRRLSAGVPCLTHNRVKRPDGLCAACGREDLSSNARAGAVAA